MTSPLPPADDVQPDRPTISAPLTNGDWPAAPPATVGKWSSSEVFIGLTTVALLVSLFLPWFSVRAKIAGHTYTGSTSGTGAHGYLWLVLVLALIVLFVLVVPDVIDRIPARLPSHQQLILGASGLSFLLVLLAFIAKPAPTSSPAGFAGLQLQISASFGWNYGAYIGLVAAVLALLGIIGSIRPQAPASHTAR
jgi:low temperature requirement protein LtrA